MDENHLTQVALAEKLGWSPQDLSNVLGGRTTVGLKRMEEISKKLGVSFAFEIGQGRPGEKEITYSTAKEETADWGELAHKSMATPKGKPEELLFVNVFPLELAANPKNKEHQKLICSLTIPQELSAKAPIGLKIIGDSMAPTFQDGDIIGLAFKDRKIQDGRIYVVRTDSGAVVRRAFFGADKIILRPDNSAFPTLNMKLSDIEARRLIVGRVAWSFHTR